MRAWKGFLRGFRYCRAQGLDLFLMQLPAALRLVQVVAFGERLRGWEGSSLPWSITEIEASPTSRD